MTIRKCLIDNEIDVSEKHNRWQSTEEDVICSFLDSIEIEYIRNYRKLGKEVDIFIPSKNLAIEINGIWFHSNRFKTPNFHLKKLEHCNQQGISLLQFWDKEINDKKEIVCSIIQNKLGLSNRIYARKCELLKIPNKIMEKQFFEANHLQGFTGSSHCYGLFFDRELIACMSFCKSRFSKFGYEIVRFANKTGISVIGGASRLLKAFEQEMKNVSIVSYSDLRFSDGKLYENLGFKLEHKSNPNYFYFKKIDQLFSRVKFQKHKMKKLFDDGELTFFDDKLSEKENMERNNWFHIYDCGNLVYKKHK